MSTDGVDGRRDGGTEGLHCERCLARCRVTPNFRTTRQRERERGREIERERERLRGREGERGRGGGREREREGGRERGREGGNRANFPLGGAAGGGPDHHGIDDDE